MAASDAAVSVNAPGLAPGDFWTYRTNTSLSGLSLDGRVTLTVTGHAPTVVEGTAYDAYAISISGAGTAEGTFEADFGSTAASGAWNLTGQEWIEAHGLKVLSTVFDLEAEGKLRTQPVPLPFALRVQNTTSYRLSADVWRFPLRVNDSAVVSTQMNFSEDFGLFFGLPTTPVHSAGLVWWNVTYALQPAVGVATPVGSFDSYPIRETFPDGSYTLYYYAPGAGYHARTETHTETSEIGSTELVAYRYQALEPGRFLGLTTNQWGIVAVPIAIGITLFVWWWRRRRRRSRQPMTASPPPPT